VAHHTGAPLLRAQVCAAIQLRTIATLAGHETRILFPSIACIVRCITRSHARGLPSRSTLHIHAPSAYAVGQIVRSRTPRFAYLTCGPRGGPRDSRAVMCRGVRPFPVLHCRLWRGRRPRFGFVPWVFLRRSRLRAIASCALGYVV
jgi:hypothetical protein